MGITWENHSEFDIELLSLLKKGNLTQTEIAAKMVKKFGQPFTRNSVKNRLAHIQEIGYKATSMIESNKSVEGLPTEELIQMIQERGYGVEALKLPTNEHYQISLDRFRGNIFRHLLISDTHLASKCQQLSFLRMAYDYAEKEKIKEIFHCGDLSEGNGHLYKGQEYELFIHGADAQKDYIVNNYPYKKGITTHIIGGSHDYSWYKSDGYDILKHVASERDDFDYLGNAGAYIEIMKNEKGQGISIYLIHPSGGIPYSISYRAQKLIENFAPENKPDIMYMGHLHMTDFIPMYRNVASVLAGCFQSQTPYLQIKGLYPHVGFWDIQLIINTVDRKKPGLASIKTEFRPFYVPLEEDY